MTVAPLSSKAEIRTRWLALWAAMLGFMLDAMDVLLYSFALQSIRAEFGLSNEQAGLVFTYTLLASAVGGILSGMAADRFGRQRTLIFTILLYSLASGGSATAQSLPQLLFWRSLVGLGLGAEWSAGAVLVAEYWPSDKRARAVSLMQSGWAIGYILAAMVAATVLPSYGWRAMFLIGVLPALLAVWIRRNVPEPPLWQNRTAPAGRFLDIFRGPLLRITLVATALATTVLFAYWGVFTWLPGFLAAPKSVGGAGFSVVKTSGWIIAMQLGAFAGYNCFGVLADRLGRRLAFAIYVVAAAILTYAYGSAPRWAGEEAPTVLLFAGPFLGFFGTGFFSLFGTMLAELYPTAVRGLGQGFVYNFGRGLSALAPLTVGVVADKSGLELALVLNSGYFLLGAFIVFFLPETKGREL
ncbi:MFS transporter [Bryobacter aggregatus]|uniref:MFS transporter n=1 Tax=Bryobacter aggregatus TaxID=360054 RepID=UPI0004E1C6E2|nr:MFS transporter [Bryobacter aggregatus]